SAAPKGLLMVRDEAAGWLKGMNAYNEGGRAFWLESYGGRPYRVERIKHARPIVVPYLGVAWHGGIQPGRLVGVVRGADDGWLARFCWFWPDPVPFHLTKAIPDIEFAIAAFDRLRMLELVRGAKVEMPKAPLMVPLSPAARDRLEIFAREMQERQAAAGGLL